MTRDPDESRLVFFRTAGVVRYMGLNLYRSQLPRMAAALAYRTLFAVIPILVLGLAVLGSFASEDAVQDSVRELLEYAGISELAVDPGEAATTAESSTLFGPAGGSAESVFSLDKRPRPALSMVREPAPGAGGGSATGEQRLDSYITSLVDQVRSIPFGAIGGVGLAILVYAALGMFVEVERSFNQIVGARAGRAWISRLTMYWTMLTLGTVLLISSFGVTSQIQEMVGGLAPVWVVTGLGYALTVCITTLLLLVVYTTVPNTTVRVNPALAGGLVAALLWEAGKWGFTTYLSYTTGYARFYGQLAILPVFMLWVYLTWLIVLFGLQIAHAVQSYERWRAEVAESGSGDEGGSKAPADGWSGVLIASAAARAFLSGKSIDSESAAEVAGLSVRDADRLLDRLVEAGVLRSVGEDGEYQLCRPAESISALSVLDCGLDREPEASAAGSDAVQSARSAARATLEQRTLADVAGLPGT